MVSSATSFRNDLISAAQEKAHAGESYTSCEEWEVRREHIICTLQHILAGSGNGIMIALHQSRCSVGSLLSPGPKFGSQTHNAVSDMHAYA